MKTENNEIEEENNEVEVQSDESEKYEYEVEPENKSKKKLILAGLLLFLISVAGFLSVILWQEKTAKTEIAELVGESQAQEEQTEPDNDFDLEGTDSKIKKTDFTPGEYGSQLIRGAILSLDDQKLVIKTDQGDKTFIFTKDSTIMTRDRGPIARIKPKDLSEGNQVMIDYDKNLEIIKLEKY